MKNRTLIGINYSIALLGLISCLISIVDNNIYQDGEWANAQWLGQDIVTLCIALPLLFLSLVLGVRSKNHKWELVNTGILLYFAYTYSFYMFAAELTFLYLFHLPIFGLSIFGFVISLLDICNDNVSLDLNKRGVIKTIQTYLVIIALLISLLWMSDILAHLSNPEHQSETPDGEAPLIIYSLDLALIIPLMLVSSILLFRKTNWGYILTGIILTKTSTLGFALMAMSLSMYLQELNPNLFLVILWSIIGFIGTLLTVFYLKNLTIDESARLRTG